jgi:hypothetical protein
MEFYHRNHVKNNTNITLLAFGDQGAFLKNRPLRLATPEKLFILSFYLANAIDDRAVYPLDGGNDLFA